MAGAGPFGLRQKRDIRPRDQGRQNDTNIPRPAEVLSRGRTRVEERLFQHEPWPRGLWRRVSGDRPGLLLLVRWWGEGLKSTLFTGSQAAMRRIIDDSPGPGQEITIEAIRLAQRLEAEGNTVTARWSRHTRA